jgi:hypothetical protein
MNQVPPVPAQAPQPPTVSQRSRRKSAISFAVAVLAAIVSVLELHGWHVYIGFGLVLLAAVFGLLQWRRKNRA